MVASVAIRVQVCSNELNDVKTPPLRSALSKVTGASLARRLSRLSASRAGRKPASDRGPPRSSRSIGSPGRHRRRVEARQSQALATCWGARSATPRDRRGSPRQANPATNPSLSVHPCGHASDTVNAVEANLLKVLVDLEGFALLRASWNLQVVDSKMCQTC